MSKETTGITLKDAPTELIDKVQKKANRENKKHKYRKDISKVDSVLIALEEYVEGE